MGLEAQRSDATGDVVARSIELAREAASSAADTGAASDAALGVVMNVRMVAGMMGELSSGMQAAQQHVDAARAGSSTVAEETRHTGQALEDLLHDIVDISNSARLIRSVAGQVNMLALNAAIEAARAGEHGRGFAVVADEVKSLADVTAQTTGKIDAQLEAIRRAVAELADSLRKVNQSYSTIAQTIETVATSVQQQGESFGAMIGYANEAADGAETMGETLGRAATMQTALADQLTRLCEAIGSRD